MKTMEGSRINFNVHAVFWLLLAFYPAARDFFSGVSAAQRVMHAMFLLYIVTCIIIHGNYRISMRRNIFELAVTYGLVTMIYYGLVTLYNGMQVTGVGLVDVFRPFIYLIYFLFPLLFPLTEQQFKKIVTLVLLLGIVQIAFSLFVYSSALWPIVNFYKGRLSDDILMFQFYRWSGTFGFPSDLAFFLSFILYFLLLSLRSGLYPRAAVFLGIMAVVGALVMTLSRGGLGTVAVMMIFVMVMLKGTRGVFYATLVAALFAIGVFGALQMFERQMFDISYISQLLEQGVEARSATHRVTELNFAWKTIVESFPIGLGPDRARTETGLRVIETLYGHHLIKWGIAGFLLYLVPVVYCATIAYRLWKTHEDRFIATATGALLILIISVPLIFGISNTINDRFKGLPFYYIMMGYLVMLDQRRRMRAGAAGDADSILLRPDVLPER
jgi:hypothetical protein